MSHSGSLAKGRVAGKVALVTGGASGIGEAAVRMLALEGASVVIADVQEQKGRALAAEVGEQALFLPLDVTRESDWERVLAASLERFGRLDILVNVAGVLGLGNIEEASVELWNKVMAVNGLGTFLGCKFAVAAMKAQHSGSIINISSAAGIKAAPAHTVYGASKAAVTHLTRTVALHCGQSGYRIRCNSIHPGVIETPMISSMDAAFGSHQVLVDAMVAVHPIGRLGQTADIASAILYLASDESSFVTGSALVVDGGFTCQ